MINGELERGFTPGRDAHGAEAALEGLLRGGDLLDGRMQRYGARLDELFRIYATTAPVPPWGPGLRLHGDLRGQYERYLPMGDLVPAFAYLCRQSCRYPVDTRLLSSVMSWPDLLARLYPFPSVFNPALLLRRLATEEILRRGFLFCLSIPRSFGGGFGRYPRQTGFLANWLATNRERLAASATVLDAACGCGEGTYETAEVLLAQGYDRRSTRIDASTLEPLELVAAAFGCFPHDLRRGEVFRARVSPILDRGGGEMIRFYREDICVPLDVAERYDVILCNGLLGGPLFHRKEQLAGGIGRLAARLQPGGILLVADRFHQGWKMKQQEEVLSLLRAHGLDIVEAGEGVAGVKCGTAVHPRRARHQNP